MYFTPRHRHTCPEKKKKSLHLEPESREFFLLRIKVSWEVRELMLAAPVQRLDEKRHPMTFLQIITVSVLPHHAQSALTWKIPVAAPSMCWLCPPSVSLHLAAGLDIERSFMRTLTLDTRSAFAHSYLACRPFTAID